MSTLSFERPQGYFPTDITTMLGDPEKYGDHSAYFQKLKNTVPGYYLGVYPNINRDFEEVYLRDHSDRFGGSYFQTRGGKGVSFVIPNSLTWEHSLFSTDPKGEAAFLTAWWRRHMLGNRIFIVNPYDTTGIAARINLMDEVRERTVWEIQDAYALSSAVVDPEGKGLDSGGNEAVWKKRARDLLAGIILHVKLAREFEGRRSLSTCIDYATDPSQSFIDKVKTMRSYKHDPEHRYQFRDVWGNITETHPFIAAKAQQQLDRAAGEASSVKSEYESYLSLYQENLARINTTKSDFSVMDVKYGPAPSSVYLWINPQHAKTATPFIRLFLNVLINRNLTDLIVDPTTGRGTTDHDWTCGMMLDEIYSVFGKLDLFIAQLAFIAQWGFRPWLIGQDYSQTLELYGDNESVTSNVATLHFGAQRKLKSAEMFSNMMGKGTRYKTMRSMSQMGGEWRPGMNESSYGHKIAEPDQLITNFPDEEAFILRSGVPVIPTKKLKYWEEDSSFAHRVVPFIGEQSDRIPFEQQRSQVNRRALEQQYIEFCHRLSAQGNMFNEIGGVGGLGDRAGDHFDKFAGMRRALLNKAMQRVA
ncbi:MAG: type IV secretory system conjugative DNA transfer family protein [Vulcanimicrobiaceae bacterium]